MTLSGSAARIAGKAARFIGGKIVDATVGKARDKAAESIEEFKAKHPHLLKGSKLTKDGLKALSAKMTSQACPCDCGSKRVVPDHLKRMYG
jgi:hypothetical protein